MDSSLSNQPGVVPDDLNRAVVVRWVAEIAAAMRQHRDYLVQLDAAIGDGDHGTNMSRGFDAANRALSADQTSPPGRLLVLTSRTVGASVGGASGPLWASAFRRMGKLLGNAQTFDAIRLANALEAGLQAIVELGAAAVGDKTMVDALHPAVRRLRRALEDGEPLVVALQAATEAAEIGMRSTVPLQARRGKASYLGERSIGHQDPGATSSAMIVQALERAVAH